MLGAIMVLVKDPGVDVAKLDALLNMQRQMEDRQAEQLFNTAFHEMEGRLPRIKKNKWVEYKNKTSGNMEKSFKFATWEDVDAAIRPLLREFGFSLAFNSEPRTAEGGGLIITGVLMHTGGHSKKASIPLPLDTSGGKNNLQGAGSTFSYGKRYVTQMLLNIVTEGEDDDGNSSTAGLQYIDETQLKRIKGLLADAKADEAAFLDFMGVAKLEDILMPEVAKGVNALLAKIKQNARGTAQ